LKNLVKGRFSSFFILQMTKIVRCFEGEDDLYN